MSDKVICQMCGTVIDGATSRRQFCDDCWEERRRVYMREYERQYRSAKTKQPQTTSACICRMCGREITNAKMNSRKYCDECRRERAKKAATEWNKARLAERRKYDGVIYAEPERQRPKVSLAEANAEARKHGMSYGQWQARRKG